MRSMGSIYPTAAIGLSAALLLLLTACGEPAEEQQGAIEAPVTEEAPADMATEAEPAAGETTQQ